MIALDCLVEPVELTHAREYNLARLRRAWLADGIGVDDMDAIVAFVDRHSSRLDNGYGAARAALLEAHHRKCAYCERKVSPSDAIDHHRPRRPLREGGRAEGKVLHPGYFWLTWSPDNLVIACNACNSAKGNDYPVADARVRPWDIPSADERPQWIDPLREEPAEHVRFRRDPTLGKWAIVGLTDRGREMVKALKFARHDQDWSDHIEHVERLVRPLDRAIARGQGVIEAWDDLVPALLHPRQAFRALTRAWLAVRYEALLRATPALSLPSLARSVPLPAQTPLWVDRPELADLPEGLALELRALRPSPHVTQLRVALCAFAAAGPWSLDELTRLFPVDADTLRIQLEALARAGRLAFDGATITAAGDTPPRH